MKELATKFKVRGKDGEGKVHTGWLSVYFLKGKLKTYIQEEAEENKPAMTFYVEPESIAQFVGYDCNGDEVYEGDILENDSGGEFKASLKSIITSLRNPCYCRYLENLNHRKYYRLKESGKNDNL